jgi:hypothetical protein
MERRPLHTECVYKGNFHSIELLVLDDGSCPVRGFLSALSAKDRTKVDVLFELLASHGRISNKEKFKKIEGTELWEFKSFQIRLICFFMKDKRVVICHALTKKQDKHKPKDLVHAENLRKALVGN